MNIKEKLVSNATYLALNWIAITVIPFVFWFIIGKTLPPESYGIIATSLQVAIFLSCIACFGFPTVLDKLLPELLEKGEKDKVQGLINHTTKVTLALVIGITAVSLILSEQITAMLNLDFYIFLAIIAIFIANTAGNYFKNIYFGFQDMKKIFLTNFFGQVTRIVVMVLLIYLGASHFGALGGCFMCFFVIFITRVDFKRIYRISKKVTVDKKLIYAYAVPNLIYLILVQLYANTQNIILTSMTTATLSGLFSVAITISAIVPTLPNIVISSIFPVMSKLCGSFEAKKRQLYLLKIVFRYSLVVVLPIAVSILMFSDYVVLLMSSPEYIQSASFLMFLVPAEILIAISALFLSSLYAIGEPRKQTYGWAIVTSIYVPTFLVLTYMLSATGLAIAYLSSAVLLFSISLIFVRKSLGFKFPVLDIGKIFLAIVLFIAMLLLLKPVVSYLEPYSILFQYATIAAIVAVAGISYLIVLIKANFLIKEDLEVLGILSKKIKILKKPLRKLENVFSKYATRSYKELDNL